MIFKLKRLAVLPLINNQIIIILLLSSSNTPMEDMTFANILSNLNFSFDFLTPEFLNRKFD